MTLEELKKILQNYKKTKAVTNNPNNVFKMIDKIEIKNNAIICHISYLKNTKDILTKLFEEIRKIGLNLNKIDTSIYTNYIICENHKIILRNNESIMNKLKTCKSVYQFINTASIKYYGKNIEMTLKDSILNSIKIDFIKQEFIKELNNNLHMICETVPGFYFIKLHDISTCDFSLTRNNFKNVEPIYLIIKRPKDTQIKYFEHILVNKINSIINSGLENNPYMIFYINPKTKYRIYEAEAYSNTSQTKADVVLYGYQITNYYDEEKNIEPVIFISHKKALNSFRDFGGKEDIKNFYNNTRIKEFFIKIYQKVIFINNDLKDNNLCKDNGKECIINISHPKFNGYFCQLTNDIKDKNIALPAVYGKDYSQSQKCSDTNCTYLFTGDFIVNKEQVIKKKDLGITFNRYSLKPSNAQSKFYYHGEIPHNIGMIVKSVDDGEQNESTLYTLRYNNKIIKFINAKFRIGPYINKYLIVK